MVSGRYECVASVSEGSGPSDGPSRVMKFQVFGLLDVTDWRKEAAMINRDVAVRNEGYRVASYGQQ